MDETSEMADAISACVVETMNTSTEEVVESTSFYISGLENVAITLAIIFALFIVFRLGVLFTKYIKTGKIGDFETDCFVYNLGEGCFKDVLPALIFGTFPVAILVDILGLTLTALVTGMLWPVLAILLPFMGVAYLIRRPIERKQEFIGKLDGTYGDPNSDPDCRNGGS